MRTRARLLAATVLVVVALLAPAPVGGQQPPPEFAIAELVDTTGAPVGSAFFFAEGDTVFVDLFAEGLTPGFHGVHLHQTGLCQAPFTTAGGHHNPGLTGHGAHAGDLPSLLVDGDGFGLASFETDRFDLAELLAGDGSALIIHAGRDNFANIPDRYQSSEVPGPGADVTTLATGDSGSRAACGVLQADEGEPMLAARERLTRRARAEAAVRADGEPLAAEAVLRDAAGTGVGTARFLPDPELGLIDVSVTARRLAPGFHGLHLHQTGACQPPFTTAGGHHNPGATTHGDHAGDLPPLEVTADGRGFAQVTTTRTDLGELLAGDGSAVVVHAGPDNFANIPDRYQAGGTPGPDAESRATGDSGARVACGVLEELSATDVYVDAVYAVALGRPADRAGRDYWAAYLDGGGRRAVFAAAVFGSAELNELYVRAYYELYLGRSVDRRGLRHWLEYLGRPGSRLSVLETSLLASPELYRQVGANPTDFVEALYPLLLLRDVDPSARDHWVGALDGGATRGQVVAALLRSRELTRLRVVEGYLLTLGREPDRAGLRHWAGFLARGGDLRSLYAALSASREFYDTATGGGSPTVVLAERGGVARALRR